MHQKRYAKSSNQKSAHERQSNDQWYDGRKAMQLMLVGIPSWDRPRFHPSLATTLVVWGYPITSWPNHCSGASSHNLLTSQYNSNYDFSVIWEVILFINFILTCIKDRIILNCLMFWSDKIKRSFQFIKDLAAFVQHQTDCS